MKKLIAFHGQQEIKDKYIARIKAHTLADDIVQGQYWENGKGCAVGCTIHGNDHSKYETVLGIPRAIAKLEDRIFEGLSSQDAKKFPLQFLKAIPVGADLSYVFPSMMIFLLEDCRKHANPDGKKAINSVIKAFQRQLAGEVINAAEWLELKGSAADAVAYAADADTAAYAAAYCAAYAAAYAADAEAARQKTYKKYAKELLRLLKNAPVNQ